MTHRNNPTGRRDVITGELCPNPVIRVIRLHAYAGWIVREYLDGMYDATNNVALSPGFPTFAETVAHVRGEVA